MVCFRIGIETGKTFSPSESVGSCVLCCDFFFFFYISNHLSHRIGKFYNLMLVVVDQQNTVDHWVPRVNDEMLT